MGIGGLGPGERADTDTWGEEGPKENRAKRPGNLGLASWVCVCVCIGGGVGSVSPGD